jgi:vacuolar-type H+-ATPase subunit C/Vma6
VLATEIDHRNILNVLEASAFGIEGDALYEELIPGGRVMPQRSLSSIANGGRSAMMDVLRNNAKFDIAGFEEALQSQKRNVRLMPSLLGLTQENTHRCKR